MRVETEGRDVSMGRAAQPNIRTVERKRRLMSRSFVLTIYPLVRSYPHWVLGSRLVRGASAVVLACLSLFGSASAGVVGRPGGVQTFRGTIVGTVSDVNGGAIPDAAVTARNISTGLDRATITDSAGNYAIPELPIGTYEVTVTKGNFKVAKVTSVRV